MSMIKSKFLKTESNDSKKNHKKIVAKMKDEIKRHREQNRKIARQWCELEASINDN